MHGLIAPTFNFLVLLALLVYFLREPLKNFVHQRHLSIRDELKTVRDLLRDAQEKHDEFSAKLKAIEVETTSLRQQAKQDAQAAKLRVLTEAQRLSGTIVSDARSSASTLLQDMKREIYLELGQHVIERSETLIKERLTAEDRVRVRKDFTTQLEAVQ